MTLKDKVAIVTGAGQGIGYEIARSLIAEGARILLNDSDGRLAVQAAERLLAEGGAMVEEPGSAGPGSGSAGSGSAGPGGAGVCWAGGPTLLYRIRRRRG